MTTFAFDIMGFAGVADVANARFFKTCLLRRKFDFY